MKQIGLIFIFLISISLVNADSKCGLGQTYLFPTYFQTMGKFEPWCFSDCVIPSLNNTDQKDGIIYARSNDHSESFEITAVQAQFKKDNLSMQETLRLIKVIGDMNKKENKFALGKVQVPWIRALVKERGQSVEKTCQELGVTKAAIYECMMSGPDPYFHSNSLEAPRPRM